MQENETQSKLAKAFKIDEMPEAERDAFFARAGMIIIDAAVGRLLLSLNEVEVAKLELYFDTHEDVEDIMSYLLDTYPTFEDFLQEETLVLQSEAEKVISPATK